MSTQSPNWLSDIRGFVFDMDGVLWVGKKVLPGVDRIFNHLAARGLKYRLATNNSTSTAASYVTKLAKLGANVPEDAILTSGIAVREYIKANYPADVTVGAIGMSALFEVLYDQGGLKREDHRPQVMVVGTDLNFAYKDLKRACLGIRAGADFIATNPDVTLPTEEGLVPGCGALIAAVVAATGKNPTVIGKPERHMFELSYKALGLEPAQVLMIGDRLDTDILGANRIGARTALVLTGVSQREDIETSGIEPTVVVENLDALLALLIEAQGA